jgi:hypothetical protein
MGEMTGRVGDTMRINTELTAKTKPDTEKLLSFVRAYHLRDAGLAYRPSVRLGILWDNKQLIG